MRATSVKTYFRTCLRIWHQKPGKSSSPTLEYRREIGTHFLQRHAERDKCVRACVLSHVWLFVTPWTVAHQDPLSMELSRKEYWSWLPFPSPVDLPLPHYRQIFYHLSHQGSPLHTIHRDHFHISFKGKNRILMFLVGKDTSISLVCDIWIVFF